MGLTLDEPKDNDEKHTIDGLTVIVDPFAMRVIKEFGGISIKSSIFGPMAELQNRPSAGCGC